LLCSTRNPVMQFDHCHAWVGAHSFWSSRRRTAGNRVEPLDRTRREPNMFGTVVNRLRTYRKYHETYRELSRLSSRELDDLGIARADIPAIARRAAI
jgi:uncharacterized protein YjiS (DUF1127 family)